METLTPEQPSVITSCCRFWLRQRQQQPARAGLPHSPQLWGLGGLASTAFMSCLAGVVTSDPGEATADRWPPEPGAPVCGGPPACRPQHIALTLSVCSLVPVSQLRRGSGTCQLLAVASRVRAFGPRPHGPAPCKMGTIPDRPPGPPVRTQRGDASDGLTGSHRDAPSGSLTA